MKLSIHDDEPFSYRIVPAHHFKKDCYLVFAFFCANVLSLAVCSRPFELAILYDVSGSMNSVLLKMTNFSKELLKNLDVSDAGKTQNLAIAPPQPLFCFFSFYPAFVYLTL